MWDVKSLCCHTWLVVKMHQIKSMCLLPVEWRRLREWASRAIRSNSTWGRAAAIASCWGGCGPLPCCTGQKVSRVHHPYRRSLVYDGPKNDICIGSRWPASLKRISNRKMREIPCPEKFLKIQIVIDKKVYRQQKNRSHDWQSTTKDAGKTPGKRSNPKHLQKARTRVWTETAWPKKCVIEKNVTNI